MIATAAPELIPGTTQAVFVQVRSCPFEQLRCARPLQRILASIRNMIFLSLELRREIEQNFDVFLYYRIGLIRNVRFMLLRRRRRRLGMRPFSIGL